jgi:protein SCO1/2
MRLQATLAALAVVATGLNVLAAVTDGFRVGDDRRVAASGRRERPRSLPDTQFVDQSSRPFRMSELRGRPALVEFFYTRCPAICGLLASEFQAMFDRLAERPAGPRGIAARLQLGFGADGVAELADYAARLGVDGRVWRLARVDDPVGLKRLLDATRLPAVAVSIQRRDSF